MAHETILIVDDSPSLLKLAAALLRSEEYLVHIASNAEQALSTLRMLRPALILVDLQLPGINGLELTRQIRQIGNLRHVLIIAMTALSRNSIEQEALDAGCNGFIAKPFDSLKLGLRIRQYVEFESPASPALLPATIDNLPATAPETGILLRTLLEEHSRELAANAPLADSLRCELAQKRIGVFGFPDGESYRVSSALERVGARPLAFSADEWPDPGVMGDCDAIMLHVRPESRAIKWLTSALDSSFPRPVILAGKRGHLQDLDISLQLWASDLLIDLWQPEEMLMRVGLVIVRNSLPAHSFMAAGSRVLTRPSSGKSPHGASGPFGPGSFRSEVVVADDDASIQILVETVLKNHGVNCQIVSSGTDALQMIRARRPYAAILDVNMPGKTGFEVLAEIRREELPVRVILLTARQQEDDTTRAFKLGADDYVVKPFNPMDLLMRLRRLSHL
jgi:two-component system, cell cycle response regulator DivK